MILDTFEEFFELIWGTFSSKNLEAYIAFIVTILLFFTLFRRGAKR
jgi:hypothetical protein